MSELYKPVSAQRVEEVAVRVLTNLGTAEALAAQVVSPLVHNERQGYRSHGLLRLRDYATNIKKGTLDVYARPVARKLSEQLVVVDGQRCFGVLAAREVEAQLVDSLRNQPLCAVALVNSTHIGRPHDIGERVAREGFITLGFVNNPGALPRVMSWKGGAQLRTNPLLVALPREESPFVLDISTSAVAEGKLRELQLAGESAPEGWLVDEDWNPVHDVSRAFAEPPTAFIPPLGGPQGYKGFGLGIAVEILAGIVAGAGFDGKGDVPVGNGGLFLGMSPTLFGRSREGYLEDVGALRSMISGEEVRWPGEMQSAMSDDLDVHLDTWDELLRLAEMSRGVNDPL